MSDNNFVIIDNFIRERGNGVIENYHIIVSDSSVYLFNSSQNYEKYLEKIFFGIGGVASLLGGPIGFIGELASEITGDKLSKILKEYSQKSSTKNIKKLIKNLDTISSDKKGVTRINFVDLLKVTIKKGYIINGISSVEFILKNENVMLKSRNRNKIDELVSAISAFNDSTKITTKYL